MLLVEGLTLAGARRKLEEESAPVGADEPKIDELIGRNARERLTTVKRGLRSILELLAGGGGGFQLSPPQPAPVSRARPVPVASRKMEKTSRGKPPAPRRPAGRSTHARRKRSA
jgi:hypothetical protein